MVKEKSISINRENNLYKLLTIGSLLLIAIALLIAHFNPTTGYELDIYTSTPTFTWIFIFIAMLCGTGIIIKQVVYRGSNQSKIWLLGFLIIILCYISFLYIPYIRNYYTWRGDNITHWGIVKSIINSGHFIKENYYPLTHSIISQLILITNIPIYYAANLSTALLSVFFIISTYLLSTIVLRRREQQLIATVITTIVFLEGGYHVFLMPNGWSIFLIPLFFYLFFKSQSGRLYLVPFLILLIMYPFFHPLSSLMIAILLIVIYFMGLPVKVFLKRENRFRIFAKSNLYLIFGIIELVVLITWILLTGSFGANIQGLLKGIISAGNVIIGEMTSNLAKVNIHGLDLGILYLKLYGTATILFLLTLIGLLLVFRQIKRKDNNFSFFIIDIGLIFFIVCVTYLLYLVGMFGLNNIGGERMINYMMIFTPILASIAIFWISQKLRPKLLSYFLILILLIIPAWLSFRGLYYSPYIVQGNEQLTVKDLVGFEWIIKEKNVAISGLHVIEAPTRYFEFILGSQAANQRSDRITAQFSDHFGYEDFKTIGEQYSEDKYANITTLDRVIYSTVWKSVGRFNDSDFTKLEEDYTVSKIYSSGAIDILYINSMKGINP